MNANNTAKQITCRRCKGQGWLMNGSTIAAELPMNGRCYNCLGAGKYTPVRRSWFGVTLTAEGRTFKATVKAEGGEEGARKAAEELNLFQLQGRAYVEAVAGGKSNGGWVRGQCVSVKRITADQAQQFADRFDRNVVEIVDGKPVGRR